mmetsp:Transcript_24659/g.35384  ORF Transcript_24659/g.35384 Transcript_24659/m.35384 type:complete len:182 (+) Transcript_24659:2818-3363(+)
MTPPKRNFLNLPWTKVHHASYSGVTDSYWFLGTTLPMLGSPTLRYPRWLRTLLSSAAPSHRPHSPPINPDSLFDETVYLPASKFLHCGGLLPLRTCASVLVCCPSVFTLSKWCSRRLTIPELCAAFDLPEFLTAHLSTTPGVDAHRLPFLSSVPSKILRGFLVDSILLSGAGGGFFSPRRV